MLAPAITALFALTGLIALATVARCLIEARAAYVRLMREGEVLRAGFALQAAAVDMAMRPAPRPAVGRAMAAGRPAMPQPRPARAAA